MFVIVVSCLIVAVIIFAVILYFCLKKYNSVEDVPLKMVLAFPGRYENKLVRINETLVLTHNNLRMHRFELVLPAEPGTYNRESIEVFYGWDSQEYVMLDVEGQSVKVEGRVQISASRVYIQATKLTWV